MKKKMTVYAVLRMDNAMLSVDVFGKEHWNELPKGQYVIPAFSSKKEAEKHADGRFEIIAMEATPNAEP